METYANYMKTYGNYMKTFYVLATYIKNPYVRLPSSKGTPLENGLHIKNAYIMAAKCKDPIATQRVIEEKKLLFLKEYLVFEQKTNYYLKNNYFVCEKPIIS